MPSSFLPPLPRLLGLKLPALLLSCALLASCAGEQSPLLPPQAESEIAPPLSPVERAADREHQRLLAAFGGEYRSPALLATIQDIVQRLVKAGDGQIGHYEVTMLNSPVVNAFALPTGRLYVTRGLLALANDTAEIASVLAHEIAHVTARHAMERAERELESALVGAVVSQVLKDPAAGAAFRSGSKLSLARFSRQQELVADQISVANIARAGFDPYGAGRFLAALGRNTAFRSASREQSAEERRLDILSSHPSTPERIAAVTASARQIAAPGIGERDAGRWLAAIDGLAYGDDPRDGVVRGRRYLNSALLIAFEAPEGFALEAARDMVIGVGAGGTQALRFDAVTPSPGQTLEAYVASGWIEGVETREIERLDIAGRPAVLAAGRGSDWSFRMAAIRLGDKVYRFILAGRAGNDPHSALRAVVESFRVLSPEQARAARPARIAIVTAGPGDSVASFGARMAVPDRGAALFALLNGIEAGAALAPGRRYKLVVE